MRVAVGFAFGMLMLRLFSPQGALAQGRTDAWQARHQPRFSVEAGAGVQIDYAGDMQLLAIGFAPARSLAVLVTAERAHIKDEFTAYPDGYSFSRGGTTHFITGELRYAFLSRRRLSPYALVGWGAGTMRQNVSERAPTAETQTVSVFYFGPGLRIAAGRHFDVLVDARLTTQGITSGPNRSEMGVFMPLRVGLSWNF